MAQKLRGTAIETFWAGTSFLLCSTVFQPFFASFSHIFGRTPMIMTALVFFLIGAIVGGTAQSFTAVLAGRSLQGIGGGGLIALSEIVVTDVVPLRERGNWFGIISSMWALGTVIGPVVGGSFAEKVSWVRLTSPSSYTFNYSCWLAVDLLSQLPLCCCSSRAHTIHVAAEQSATAFARSAQAD